MNIYNWGIPSNDPHFITRKEIGLEDVLCIIARDYKKKQFTIETIT
jgi:hypothetical protein